MVLFYLSGMKVQRICKKKIQFMLESPYCPQKISSLSMRQVLVNVKMDRGKDEDLMETDGVVVAAAVASGDRLSHLIPFL